MRPAELFKDVRYAGQAEGDRKTYYVFESSGPYLVVGPTGRGGYYVNVVDRDAPEFLTKRFKGKKVTSGTVTRGARRHDLFRNRLAALNALYVMVALRRARKLKQREGKAIVFKIR